VKDIDKILVVVDPTVDTQPALEKATHIAARFDARIELYCCETKAVRDSRLAAHFARGPGDDFIYDVRTIVEALALPGRERGLDISVETESGDPLHARILERAERIHADLAIKDTHHHALARRTIFTNTDWHLIRDCPVPLLLTKPSAWQDSPVVVAAVDPGHLHDKPALLDHQVLNYARAAADRLGGAVHVFHAYLATIPAADAAIGALSVMSLTPEVLAQLRTAKEASLAELAIGHGIDPMNAHLRMGVPAECLPAFAEELHADIVAMGAVSRSGLQRLFLGSTAEQVLERIPCDALIVKSSDFRRGSVY
jgi:universal stress protein E